MITNSNFCHIFILLFLSYSCTNKDIKNPNQIIANDQDEEYFICLDDSTKDVYNFHSNRKLRYYMNSKNGETWGEAIYFYYNGRIRRKVNMKNGKFNGSLYDFYPSGNLRQVKYFVEDSLRGYFVEYYDKFNTKKAECMSSPNIESGYIYRRSYDSNSQKIIDVIDHRLKEMEKYPSTNPESLKMPWEDNSWNKK